MGDNRATRILRFDGNDGFARRALGGLALLAAAVLVGCGADKVAPAAPTGLSAAAGNQLVTLTWVANSEEDLVGYDVHQGTASGALVKVATLAAPASSHVVAGLTNGTPWFFALTASDKAGNVSGLSAEVSAVPFAPDVIPPTLVVSVPAAGASGVPVGTPITLTFSEDMDTRSVVVTIAPLIDLGAPAWSDPRTVGFQPGTSLAFGTAYTLTVDGKDAAGNPLAGLKSVSFSTATETLAPAIPTGLSALPGNQLVTLTWDANTEPDLAGYDVFQGTVSGTLTRVASLTAPATTHVATGLINGTAYFFALAARDLAGNVSERTPEVSVTPLAPDLMHPTVSLSVPATTGVARDTAITLAFSEDMDPGSVVVTLAPLPPLGELGPPLWIDGKTVTFQPTALLAYNTTYALNVTGNDLAGLALQGTTTFSFTTANPPDLEAPTVLGTGPADGATAVGVNTNITFEFSEPMNQASVQGAFSSTPAVTCTWAISADGRSFTCVHAVPLTFAASYVVTMGTGAMDLATNHLAEASIIHFTAAAAPDIIRPVVCPPTGGSEPCPATSATAPAPGAIGVSRSTNIVVRFSEPMNQASVQAAFAITAPAGHSTGLFTWNAAGDTVTFNPDVNFAYGDNVSWRIGTGATDLASPTPNALLNTFTSTFRVIRQATGLIYSNPAIDGFIMNTGSVYLTFTYAAAGDTAANLYVRSFFSFDLSPLPAAANVTAATLYVYQQAAYGTPYTDLGDLLAASVDYGSSLTAADFETPIIKTLQCPPCVPPICIICNPLIYTRDEIVTLSATSSVGTKSVDVARKVRDDLADGRSRAQFRVFFPTTTNADGSTDDALLFTGETSNGTNRARLSLTYEYP